MRLLLLAGSGEARRIAVALAAMPWVDATASLAGATRQPNALAIPTRVGGFGGAAGFRGFLASEKIDAVLDATHPFAARITRRTAEICRDIGLPHAVVLRPEWQPGPGDDWRFIDHEKDAAAFIPPGATVFLGTGVQGLSGFANLRGRRVICRRIDAPDAPFPFAGGEFLVGRPPFSMEDEISLFQRLGVDWLVVKNSGGMPSRSKLDAARALSIKVALLNRPARPDAVILETVEAALHWVGGLA
ncbi:MAG: cobalt-precorrin-6A reductase [Rhodobacter sp.]|nr:cobalt-precorrin-6A reductase [Rhodobacter sp.]